MTTPSVSGSYWTNALTQTAVQTANCQASANQIVPVSTASGNVTVTLPNAPAAGSLVAVKMVTQGSTNTVTVKAIAGDVFNKAGGGTTATLSLPSQGMLLQYNAGIWIILADDLPLAQLETVFLPLPTGTASTGQVPTVVTASPLALDWAAAAGAGTVTSVTATDTSIVVSGTSTIAPTIATGTLDVIAAQHPPAANWSNNSRKITSLANGSGAQDAAAYGQTPAGGATVTVVQGGTGDTSLTAYALLAGGTTSSGAVQSLASPGSGGQVPTSTGAGALPVMAGPFALACEPSGTLACRIPSAVITTSSLAAFTAGGQVAVAAIGLPKGMVVSNLSLLIGGTPANGPIHFWVALLDSTLHVLAVSADGTSGAIAANTLKTTAVTIDGSTPYTVASTGIYYVATSASATTTAPTAAGNSAAGSTAGLSSPVLCGTAGTQAAPPSVAAQLNGGTVSFSTSMNFAAWVS